MDFVSLAFTNLRTISPCDPDTKILKEKLLKIFVQSFSGNTVRTVIMSSCVFYIKLEGTNWSLY